MWVNNMFRILWIIDQSADLECELISSKYFQKTGNIPIIQVVDLDETFDFGRDTEILFDTSDSLVILSIIQGLTEVSLLTIILTFSAI